MIEGEVLGTLSIGGRGVVYGTLSIDGTGLDGTAETDGSLADVISRRFGPVQRLGFEVYVGGVLVPHRSFVGPVTVDMSMSSHLQTAQFTLAVEAPDGVLGNPVVTNGPAFGTATINIFGLFSGANGEIRIPLLVEGIAHQIERKGGSPGTGWTEVYTIIDRAGRIDHLTTTLSIPAGSGLGREAIVRRIFLQLGISDTLLEKCNPVNRLTEYVDADPIRAATTLMDVEGRALFFDPNGILVNPLYGDVVPGQAPVWTFTERDILTLSDLDAPSPSEVVTDVTLSSTMQILHPPADEVGSETKSTEVEITALYQPVSAALVQAGGCGTTPLPSVPFSPRIMPISKTVSTTESQGGAVILEETQTEGWKILETARYVYAPANVRNCRTPVYLLAAADPAGNGSEPAYAEQNELWRTVGLSLTRHYFDRPGFLGPPADPGDASQPWGNHFLGTGRSTGIRLGKVTDTFGWYMVGAALKQLTPGTSWEATDPITGIETAGDGRGVEGGAAIERFILVSRTVEVIEATDDNFIKADLIYTYGYTPGLGSGFWYQGGTVGGAAAESFQLLTKQETVYIPTGQEGSYVTEELSFDYQQTASPTTKTTRFTGAPPAVEILPSSTPDSGTFNTPEEAKAASVARNTETQAIVAHVVSESLEEIHPKRIVKTTAADAETVQELADVARRMMELSAAIPITFMVPFNPAVKLAQVARVVHHPLGVDAVGKVEALHHSLEFPGPCTTTVTLLKYPTSISFEGAN